MELSISNYLKDFPQKKKGSERTDILKQIYSFYDTVQESELRRKENWKRYVKYLKDGKIRHTPEEVKKFKKNKLFLKPISPASMAFFVSHIPTKDLYYVLSVAKDKSFRGENIGAFIVSFQISKKA
jgi:hypothetical protein